MNTTLKPKPNNINEVECRYCHTLGHIKDKCPKLLYKNKTTVPLPPKKQHIIPPKSIETTFNDNFPVLGIPKITQQLPLQMSFASLVKKYDEIQIPEKVELKENEVIINGMLFQKLL